MAAQTDAVRKDRQQFSFSKDVQRLLNMVRIIQNKKKKSKYNKTLHFILIFFFGLIATAYAVISELAFRVQLGHIQYNPVLAVPLTDSHSLKNFISPFLLMANLYYIPKAAELDVLT